MTVTRELMRLAIKKANKSPCHQRVSAIGINSKGDIVMTATNLPRFSKEGGGVHAEMRILKKRPTVKTILICRVGEHGRIMPIHPCQACANKARELGVRIITVKED